MIEFQRPDGKSLPGYLAETVGRPNAPGIVLLEEWWGVNGQIKGIADRYAALGYRTLIPDLFRGRLAADANEANHLLSALDFNDATSQDVRGAVRYLREAGASRIGVTGYCMGGALAILAAMHVPGVDAVVSFYGYPPPQAGDPKTIAVPLLVHAAAHDAFFKLDGAIALVRSVQEAGAWAELHEYEAEHAFCNPDPPPRGLGHFRPELADLAWHRTVEFWKRTLA